MEKKNKWNDVYEYRRMIDRCKAIMNNTCDDDEYDLMNEMVHDYENRIRELVGV